MSKLIDNITRDVSYSLEIYVRGSWHDGERYVDKFGYTIKVHNVPLVSRKTYRRYYGAQAAARKLISKLEEGK